MYYYVSHPGCVHAYYLIMVSCIIMCHIPAVSMLITLLWFDVLLCVTSRLCSCLLPYYGLMYYYVSHPGCVHAYYLIMVSCIIMCHIPAVSMLITLLWFDVLLCVTSRLCPCLLPYYGLMYYYVSHPGCVHAYYLYNVIAPIHSYLTI